MNRFDGYRDSFPNAGLTRSKTGVLEVALHTDGGTLVFNGHTHEQFVDLFHAIGSDPKNRVVILTGSGDAFMETISPDGFDFFTPRGYDKIYREGKKVLMNILDIEVPLIAAVNGPVRLHSEYILLADIVLASPSTVFQDKPHFEFGIVPGDGVNLLWQEVIGSVRGRYFILTRQELDAETAREWGAVNEIVPANALLARAHEIAEGLAKLPRLTSSYTRIALTQKSFRAFESRRSSESDRGPRAGPPTRFHRGRHRPDRPDEGPRAASRASAGHQRVAGHVEGGGVAGRRTAYRRAGPDERRGRAS